MIFGFIDPGVLTQHTSVVRAWELRYFLILPAAVSMLTSTYFPWYLNYSQVVGIAIYSVIGAGWVLLCIHTEPLAIPYACLALIQTYIFAFSMIGLFFRSAFISSAAITVVISVAIWTGSIDLSLALLTHGTLLSIFALLSMSAFQKEISSRTLYVLEHRQRDNALRQAKSNARYLEWLRQLARFLRHEVRQPVAQINSSIELLALKTGTNDTIKPILRSVSQGALQIWNLIERASQATDAEAFVRQSVPQLTKVDDLLASLVNAFRDTHSGVTFSHDCRPLELNVDPILLKEAVGNLLSNAASYALHGSTVYLRLDIMDTYAVISVRNEGDLIHDDKERLFHPFISTRTHTGGDHHGIGLYIVRLIAEHYGGTAIIRNIDDGSGVEASITLSLQR